MKNWKLLTKVDMKKITGGVRIEDTCITQAPGTVYLWCTTVINVPNGAGGYNTSVNCEEGCMDPSLLTQNSSVHECRTTGPWCYNDVNT